MPTVQIAGGTPIKLADEVMTVLEALQSAVDNTMQTPLSFTFSTTYSGDFLGTMVTAINGTSDSSNLMGTPFFFWQLSINGTVNQSSIDSVNLNPSDAVSLTFVTDSTSSATARSRVKNAVTAPAKRPAAKAKR
jgi:hypothetical protein